ncbi:MAG: FlgD immunoglobulin-like domain containing protein, partial [Candidatus Eisenbacteria bacterium]|nr:FlgD immunoglobulin-like domain containing protein [Candidatus Eisenbacteria bacterium]
TPLTGICLDLEVPTVGELIPFVDSMLAVLEPLPLDAPVKEAYGSLISCLDDINNGTGIPPCRWDDEGDWDVFYVDSPADAETDGRTGANDATLELYRPVPNPFTGITRMAFAVPGPGAERVDIAIFDASGRQVRNLVHGSLGPGVHESLWDGSNDAGHQVPAGIYLYRVRLGARSEVIRVVYLR